MNPSSAPTCPKCHAVLPTDAPAGLCPRCIMALNFTGDTVTDGAPQQPAPTPEELAPHFPQLEIVECLGRGGMGVVYKARQTSLGRLVALKLLAPERVADAKFADRFAQEAKALAALNHPNIVTIHDFGQAGGFYFLLMEFVDGVNLRQAMKAGRFTPEQALAVVPPVCEALQFAHEHGIVHRDIKPENLLLDKDGRVKIADFGVAKMLHADDPNISVAESQPAGTPQYMAPEQKGHRRTDHRADIYSLGVVLYELLTGELPADKLQPPSRKVQIDVRLDEIVLRALESKPELRFQTASEFRTQVEAAISTPGGGKREEPQAEGRHFGGTRQTAFTLGVMGVVLIILAGFAIFGPAEYKGNAFATFSFLAIAAFFQFVVWLAGRKRGAPSIGELAAAGPATASSIALAIILLLLGIVIPIVGIRWHNGSVQAAAEDHMKYIRSLQSGVTSLSTQIGEANAVAGRAASRAGNSEEREETRAQAREERRMYEQRSASLQADLNRLQAALAVAGNKQVDPHSWRAVSLVATGLLLTLAGGGMLIHLRRRSGAGRTIEPGGPAVGGSAQGITTTPLFIVWWFATLPFVIYCAVAIHAKDSFPVVVMLIAMPVFALLARVKAQQWRAASDAESGPRWLRAFSWLGWLLAIPVVGLALFFIYSLASETGSWNPAPSEAVMVPLTFLGTVLLPWAAAHLWQVSRFRAGTSLPTAVEAVRPPFKYVALLLLIPVLLIGVLFVKFAREGSSPSGVTSFDVKPVEVRGNVVVVDVTTEVARGNAELRAVLDGRRLPVATEAALADTFFPPFAGNFVKPAPHGGNHPWFILSPGRQTQRLGFVLPDAAAAKVAFDNLRPIGPLPAVAGRTVAGTLFALQQSEGEDYRASLQVAPPLTAADPNWVSVTGSSQSNESAVTLTWEVLASRPGLAQFSRAGSPIKTLLRNPQTKLYGVSAKLELTKMGADRVRFVRRLGHSVVREEFSGNFRDLADELLRTKTMSAKTVCGMTVELCQFQGKPFTVQVQTQGGPSTTSVFAPLEVVKWTGPSIPLLLVGIVVIALIVVLARKSASAGKAVLWVAGALLLLLAIAVVVMPAVRRMSRDSEQAATVEQMPNPPESSDNPGAVPLEKPLIEGSLPAIKAAIPERIDFKVLHVENPPGTRNILLHFERDSNYGLAIETWQDVTASPDGKVPKEGFRTAQQKTWIGLNGGRVLGWTLPQEFTDAEASALAREMERKWKGSHPLPDGAVPEFAAALHRDGWKYHLAARVLREPGSPRPPAFQMPAKP